MLRKTISIFIFIVFLIQTLCADVVLAQVLPVAAAPGIQLTQPFVPAMVRGITLYPDNPLKFNFLIDPGDQNQSDQDFQKESTKLIRYFLAALTTPEEDMWVNLNPKEKDRIIPASFGTTEMGQELLGQDYILKQLTTSLMNPDEKLGKEFWARVYKEANQKYGSTDIPLDSLSKVWIVPDKAEVLVKDKTVVVVDSHLKVMMESEYLKQENQNIQAEILKEVILPAIEKEVNEGKNFAPLRQIQNSAILAAWYKKNLKRSLLGAAYVDQKKTNGIESDKKDQAEKIYNQYLEAFKKGAYDVIKEEYNSETQEVVNRKYVSGGAKIADRAVLSEARPDDDAANLEKIRRTVIPMAFEFLYAEKGLANGPFTAGTNSQFSDQREGVKVLKALRNQAPFALVTQWINSYPNEGKEGKVSEIIEFLGALSRLGDEGKVDVEDLLKRFPVVDSMRKSFADAAQEMTIDSLSVKEREALLNDYLVGSNFVDIGSGSNLLVARLAQLNPKIENVVGVDIEKQGNSILPANADFRIMQDPQQIPVQDNFANSASLIYVLHHVDMDPSLFMEEVRRVMQVQGRLIVLEDTFSDILPVEYLDGTSREKSKAIQMMFDALSPEDKISFLHFADWFIHNFINHSRKPLVPGNYKSMEEWKKIFEASGFTVVKEQYVGFSAIGSRNPTSRGFFVLEKKADSDGAMISGQVDDFIEQVILPKATEDQKKEIGVLTGLPAEMIPSISFVRSGWSEDFIINGRKELDQAINYFIEHKTLPAQVLIAYGKDMKVQNLIHEIAHYAIFNLTQDKFLEFVDIATVRLLAAEPGTLPSSYFNQIYFDAMRHLAEFRKDPEAFIADKTKKEIAIKLLNILSEEWARGLGYYLGDMAESDKHQAAIARYDTYLDYYRSLGIKQPADWKSRIITNPSEESRVRDQKKRLEKRIFSSLSVPDAAMNGDAASAASPGNPTNYPSYRRDKGLLLDERAQQIQRYIDFARSQPDQGRALGSNFSINMPAGLRVGPLTDKDTIKTRTLNRMKEVLAAIKADPARARQIWEESWRGDQEFYLLGQGFNQDLSTDTLIVHELAHQKILRNFDLFRKTAIYAAQRFSEDDSLLQSQLQILSELFENAEGLLRLASAAAEESEEALIAFLTDPEIAKKALPRYNPMDASDHELYMARMVLLISEEGSRAVGEKLEYPVSSRQRASLGFPDSYFEETEFITRPDEEKNQPINAETIQDFKAYMAEQIQGLAQSTSDFEIATEPINLFFDHFVEISPEGKTMIHMEAEIDGNIWGFLFTVDGYEDSPTGKQVRLSDPYVEMILSGALSKEPEYLKIMERAYVRVKDFETDVFSTDAVIRKLLKSAAETLNNKNARRHTIFDFVQSDGKVKPEFLGWRRFKLLRSTAPDFAENIYRMEDKRLLDEAGNFVGNNGIVFGSAAQVSVSPDFAMTADQQAMIQEFEQSNGLLEDIWSEKRSQEPEANYAHRAIAATLGSIDSKSRDKIFNQIYDDAKNGDWGYLFGLGLALQDAKDERFVNRVAALLINAAFEGKAGAFWGIAFGLSSKLLSKDLRDEMNHLIFSVYYFKLIETKPDDRTLILGAMSHDQRQVFDQLESQFHLKNGKSSLVIQANGIISAALPYISGNIFQSLKIYFESEMDAAIKDGSSDAFTVYGSGFVLKKGESFNGNKIVDALIGFSQNGLKYYASSFIALGYAGRYADESKKREIYVALLGNYRKRSNMLALWGLAAMYGSLKGDEQKWVYEELKSHVHSAESMPRAIALDGLRMIYQAVKNGHMDHAMISDAVTTHSEEVFSRYKMSEAKIQEFLRLGLSREELAKDLKRYPNLVRADVGKIQREFADELAFSDQDLVYIINKFPPLVMLSMDRNVKPKWQIVEQFKLSPEASVEALIQLAPQSLMGIQEFLKIGREINFGFVDYKDFFKIYRQADRDVHKMTGKKIAGIIHADQEAEVERLRNIIRNRYQITSRHANARYLKINLDVIDWPDAAMMVQMPEKVNVTLSKDGIYFDGQRYFERAFHDVFHVAFSTLRHSYVLETLAVRSYTGNTKYNPDETTLARLEEELVVREAQNYTDALKENNLKIAEQVLNSNKLRRVLRKMGWTRLDFLNLVYKGQDFERQIYDAGKDNPRHGVIQLTLSIANKNIGVPAEPQVASDRLISSGVDSYFLDPNKIYNLSMEFLNAVKYFNEQILGASSTREIRALNRDDLETLYMLFKKSGDRPRTNLKEFEGFLRTAKGPISYNSIDGVLGIVNSDMTNQNPDAVIQRAVEIYTQLRDLDNLAGNYGVRRIAWFMMNYFLIHNGYPPYYFKDNHDGMLLRPEQLKAELKNNILSNKQKRVLSADNIDAELNEFRKKISAAEVFLTTKDGTLINSFIEFGDEVLVELEGTISLPDDNRGIKNNFYVRFKKEVDVITTSDVFISLPSGLVVPLKELQKRGFVPNIFLARLNRELRKVFDNHDIDSVTEMDLVNNGRLSEEANFVFLRPEEASIPRGVFYKVRKDLIKDGKYFDQSWQAGFVPVDMKREDLDLSQTGTLKRDAAMTVEKDLGGIDLNPNQTELNEQGVRIDFEHFYAPSTFSLDQLNVNGFVPVILQISPPISLPLLLGIRNEMQSPDSLAQATND